MAADADDRFQVRALADDQLYDLELTADVFEWVHIRRMCRDERQRRAQVRQ
jgi:hypothetical protein